MTSLIDMAPVMDLFAFETLSVRRRSSSYNNHGVLTPGSTSTLSIKANVQPFSAAIGPNAGGARGLAGSVGKNVDLTVMGQRVQGAVVVFTQHPLHLSAAPTGMSDEFAWRGDADSLACLAAWDIEN